MDPNGVDNATKNEASPRTGWASSGRSALAALLAVLTGLAGVVLSLWPEIGLPVLAVSVALLVLGVAMSLYVSRKRRALGLSRWGEIGRAHV